MSEMEQEIPSVVNEWESEELISVFNDDVFNEGIRY